MLFLCRRLIRGLFAILRETVSYFRKLSCIFSRKPSKMTVTNGTEGSDNVSTSRPSSIPSWSLEGKVALVTGSSKLTTCRLSQNLSFDM